LTEYSTACDSGLIVISNGTTTINQTCVSGLSELCQNRQAGVSGTPTNILQDYTSNCPNFKFFMEQVLVPETFGTVAQDLNVQYMDPLKQFWCDQDFNYDNPECLCMSALARNQQFNQQCKLNVTSCSGFPQNTGECYAQFFSKQNNGDSYNGETYGPGIKFINISFDRCQPYYCWTDICWDPDVYKPFGAFRSQSVGCGNVCISVKGENTMTINDISNAAFSNIRPATTTMPVCNQNSDAINLFYLPEFFRSPLNLFTFIPVNVGNQSNGITAFMKLESSLSNNSLNSFWFTPPPNTNEFIEIPGNAQATLNFAVDTTLLQQIYSTKTPVPNPNRANVPEVYVCYKDQDPENNSCGTLTPDEYILSPTYTYSYVQTVINPDGTPSQTTSFITLYANLIVLPSNLSPSAPPSKPIAADNPTWLRYVLVGCFLIFLLTYFFKTMSNSYAVKLYPLLKQQVTLNPPPP
jgi:hypothetical protein